MAWDSGSLDAIAGVAAVYIDGLPPQGPVLCGLSFLARIERGLTPVMAENY